VKTAGFVLSYHSVGTSLPEIALSAAGEGILFLATFICEPRISRVTGQHGPGQTVSCLVPFSNLVCAFPTRVGGTIP